MYEIETDDLYYELSHDAVSLEEMENPAFHWPTVRPARELFDFSNYPRTHPEYMPYFPDNKAMVGFMKDETAGDPIVEFVGLRPKMYSFKTMKVNREGQIEYSEKHRAKGIQRVAAAELRHADYLRQLEHPEENYIINRRLGSKLHSIYGIEVFVASVLTLSSNEPINLRKMLNVSMFVLV